MEERLQVGKATRSTPRIHPSLRALMKLFPMIRFLRIWLSSGKGQARIGKGWPSGRKASKLKPLRRAYTKVGCHPPPPTTHKFNLTQLMARCRGDEAGGGKGRCVGSLWVTLGSL